MKSLPKIVILSLLGAFGLAPAGFAQVSEGQPFPRIADFRLTDHLPDQAGRVVLVDFWATWCAPCRSAMPAYDTLQSEFGGQGLTIIGVSVDRDEAAYLRFLQKFTPGFTTVRDPEQTLAAAVRPPAMPTCYLIDRQGVVRAVHRGFHGESSIRQLRLEITKLLEEKS